MIPRIGIWGKFLFFGGNVGGKFKQIVVHLCRINSSIARSAPDQFQYDQYNLELNSVLGYNLVDQP